MTPKITCRHEDAFLAATCLVELLSGDQGALTQLRTWSFQPGQVRREVLQHLGAGSVKTEQARQDGLQLVRETFTAGDAPIWAVRLLLSNESGSVLRVMTLSPVVVEGPDLRLGSTPASQWTYIRQPRHKNDMPAAVVLGSAAPGIWDAVRGTPETGGVPKSAEKASLPTRFVSADLTLLRHEKSSLLLGVFPLDQQLVQCSLELSADRQNLTQLRVDCQCDGQELAPGQTLTSQWVLIDLSADSFAAVERYAANLAEAQGKSAAGVGRPSSSSRPPTVWCSWYYYGDGCTQEEAEANLTALSARPLPIDVFQIDECWDQEWGDWYPNNRWPGIAQFAAKIRAAGYQPGLWTCPLLADVRSTTRHHKPHWLLRKRTGEPVIFRMGTDSFVLDPTHPEVLRFLEDLYRRLTHEWGYTYHKLDFTRAIADPDAVFHDRSKNRAQAYRSALEAVRRGMGPDAYLNICGGLYGPSIGIADAQRTGSDVRSEWPKAPSGEATEGYGPFTIKQNTLRFWMNRLWHNDPDALMVRRRREAHRQEKLSLGLLTDDEALTSTLNQYLGGGLVCFSENLTEIDRDRLLLLRHCSPSIARAAIPWDCLKGARFPALFDTAVTPAAKGLPPWHTLSLINWHDQPRPFQVTLDSATLGAFALEHERFRVSAFRGGWSREAAPGETIDVGALAPHACEVLKVQPLAPDEPCLLRTDGHFSMGATEIVLWQPAEDKLCLAVDWRWPTPLSMGLLPPKGRAFAGAADCQPLTLRVEKTGNAPAKLEIQYKR